MYKKYWGLKEKPFENTPDPHFMFLSPEHLEATARLIYAVWERKGAAMLTGEYGCGKTVISRLLFEILTPDKYDIALITNPFLSPTAFLQEISYQLGIRNSSNSSKREILMELNNRFFENINNKKDTVIIIDDAQAIEDPMTIEELRLLLNFQLNDRYMITLILLGQPELLGVIDRLRQFKQRLATRYHLNPLNKEDTKKYIAYRLKVAGVEKKIFSDKALVLIWEKSSGIPRMINTICDMCLLIGFTNKINEIKEGDVKKAIQDLGE